MKQNEDKSSHDCNSSMKQEVKVNPITLKINNPQWELAYQKQNNYFQYNLLILLMLLLECLLVERTVTNYSFAHVIGGFILLLTLISTAFLVKRNHLIHSILKLTYYLILILYSIELFVKKHMSMNDQVFTKEFIQDRLIQSNNCLLILLLSIPTLSFWILQIILLLILTTIYNYYSFQPNHPTILYLVPLIYSVYIYFKKRQQKTLFAQKTSETHFLLERVFQKGLLVIKKPTTTSKRIHFSTLLPSLNFIKTFLKRMGKKQVLDSNSVLPKNKVSQPFDFISCYTNQHLMNLLDFLKIIDLSDTCSKDQLIKNSLKKIQIKLDPNYTLKPAFSLHPKAADDTKIAPLENCFQINTGHRLLKPHFNETQCIISDPIKLYNNSSRNLPGIRNIKTPYSKEDFLLNNYLVSHESMHNQKCSTPREESVSSLYDYIERRLNSEKYVDPIDLHTLIEEKQEYSEREEIIYCSSQDSQMDIQNNLSVKCVDGLWMGESVLFIIFNYFEDSNSNEFLLLKQKLEEINNFKLSFLKTVSHNLRTPLNGMNILLEEIQAYLVQKLDKLKEEKQTNFLQPKLRTITMCSQSHSPNNLPQQSSRLSQTHRTYRSSEKSQHYIHLGKGSISNSPNNSKTTQGRLHSKSLFTRPNQSKSEFSERNTCSTSVKSQLIQQNIDNLSRTQYNINILTNVIDSILDYSAIKIHNFCLNIDRFDIRHLLKETCDIFQYSFREKKLSLLVEYLPTTISGPIMILNDRKRIKQVLIHLIQNALKYTSSGNCKIIVHQDVDSPELLSISIQDTGQGMNKETLDQIFHLFIKHNNDIKGIGLRLVICNNIVKFLGPENDIQIKSEMGCGTNFTFSVFRNHSYSPLTNRGSISILQTATMMGRDDLSRFQNVNQGTPKISSLNLVATKNVNQKLLLDANTPQNNISTLSCQYLFDQTKHEQTNIILQEDAFSLRFRNYTSKCQIDGESMNEKGKKQHIPDYISLEQLNRKRMSSFVKPSTIYCDSSHMCMQSEPNQFKQTSFYEQKKDDITKNIANSPDSMELESDQQKWCNQVLNESSQSIQKSKIIPQFVHNENNIQSHLIQTQNKRILIVDDSHFNQSIIERLLNNIPDIEFIDKADNGKEAIQMIEDLHVKHQPQYHLIFMDWNMPVIDGLQALIIIRQIEYLQQCPPYIIFVTASSSQEKYNIIEAGIHLFMGFYLKYSKSKYYLDEWKKGWD